MLQWLFKYLHPYQSHLKLKDLLGLQDWQQLLLLNQLNSLSNALGLCPYIKHFIPSYQSYYFQMHWGSSTLLQIQINHLFSPQLHVFQTLQLLTEHLLSCHHLLITLLLEVKHPPYHQNHHSPSYLHLPYYFIIRRQLHLHHLHPYSNLVNQHSTLIIVMLASHFHLLPLVMLSVLH